jgi:hypothetical protein
MTFGAPYEVRTRVFAVRGRRPRPLDEGSIVSRGGKPLILGYYKQVVGLHKGEKQFLFLNYLRVRISRLSTNL